VDVLLGADVLYSSEAFYPLLCTVDRFMQRNPHLVFLMTYQERTSDRVLTPYLQAFRMQAENIMLKDFVHETQLLDASVDLEGPPDADGIPISLPLNPLASVYCIKITKILK
jgi:hypothetical protein